MPISKSRKIKVGITIGDPSGIGPQITAKAIGKLCNSADFVVIGDKWIFKQLSGRQALSAIRFVDLRNVARKNFKFGKIRAEYGKASVEYLDKALELIENKEIDCLVTCPISKEAINLAGFRYPGHTEYLAEKTHTRDCVMMLLNDKIKISLVTRHIPLRNVPAQITREKIYKTITVTCESLKELFLIKNPRIAVCGLNPHASDNGLIGGEENDIIRPALKKLGQPAVAGPLAADAAMAKAMQKEYDCVIAMYHDQALIALKISGKDTGVNITLGLPFIRTSPLHGTAFDIAAGNRANPGALISAIRLAIKCAANLKKD